MISEWLSVMRTVLLGKQICGCSRLYSSTTSHINKGWGLMKNNTNDICSTPSSILTNFSWQQVRHVKRGIDFQPNTYKRIKKHGWNTRMKTTNGKITIIRRMMKGVSKRRLTH